MKHIESKIAAAVSQFLKVQYPNVIWRFDLAADLNLTISQAVRNKQLNPHRGYCDLFIAEPIGNYCGMFLELKISKEEVYKKDGTFKKKTVKDKSGKAYDHIQEQFEMIETLRKKGYYANFGLGFQDSITQIKDYMGGKL